MAPERFKDSGLSPLGWWSGNVYYNISQDLLAFRADNRSNSIDPETWAWDMTADTEALGGEIVPEVEEIGRFAVVATAKLNHLTRMPRAISSHWIGGKNTGEGRVGFAGGKAVGDPEVEGISLGAASGLWEVHDHISFSVFSIAANTARDYGLPSVIGRPIEMMFHEMINSQLKLQFDAVQEILEQQGKAAHELTRQ